MLSKAKLHLATRTSPVTHARCIAARATAVDTKATNTFDYNGEVLTVPADVQPLFQPLKLGKYELATRMVYAPLTRCRAFNNVPQPNTALYYGQRAVKGGLIISEATVVAPEGHGYPNTPGIYRDDQIEGWKPVVKAVHEKGGVFFMQIWHTGRASHPDFQPNGALPPSSSPVPITSLQVFTPSFEMKDYPTPRAVTKDEIKGVIESFRVGAKNAISAGSDGVEIHSANGYLLDQFIKDSVNMRTDEYGGSIENRCRLTLEVVKAVVDEVGADRVGIRISPWCVLDCKDSTPYATHTYLIEQLNKFNLAYVHLIEGRDVAEFGAPDAGPLDGFRAAYKGNFIAAGGFTKQSGAAAVSSGKADLIAYGRTYLANPDLPKRFILDAELNAYDRDTFYVPGDKGYTDYPFMSSAN